VDNKEKALLTYNAIQRHKQEIRKAKELEITLYNLDNIKKIRRRSR
jgi:hypothetical protein